MLMQQLIWSQSQADLFDVLLSRVLSSLRSSDGAAHRSKALKSLGLIVAEDPDVFGLVRSSPDVGQI